MRTLLINATGIALTCGAVPAFMNGYALAGIGLTIQAELVVPAEPRRGVYVSGASFAVAALHAFAGEQKIVGAAQSRQLFQCIYNTYKEQRRGNSPKYKRVSTPR